MNDLIERQPMPLIPAMPALSEETLKTVRAIETELSKYPQMHLRTLHVIHGGLYSRTVIVPADHVIVGVLVKVPTQVIVSGAGTVLVGDAFMNISGYNVLPGQSGRKAIFIAHTDMYITMVFKTDAKTLEDAENDMTDEPELLASRLDTSDNLLIVTEE